MGLVTVPGVEMGTTTPRLGPFCCLPPLQGLSCQPALRASTAAFCSACY